MKNRIITYILLGVLGVLPLTSCSDYLDKMPDDQLTLENVFSNRGNLERWLSYLYSVMPEFIFMTVRTPLVTNLHLL